MRIFDPESPLRKIIDSMEWFNEMIPRNVRQLYSVGNTIKNDNEFIKDKRPVRLKKSSATNLEALLSELEFKLLVKAMVLCKITNKKGVYKESSSLPKYRLFAFCRAVNDELLCGRLTMIELCTLLQKHLGIKVTKLKRSKDYDVYWDDYLKIIRGL